MSFESRDSLANLLLAIAADVKAGKPLVDVADALAGADVLAQNLAAAEKQAAKGDGEGG